jgi:hypothetical protein
MPVITFTDTLITRACSDLEKAASAGSPNAMYIAAHLAAVRAVRAAGAVISTRLSPERASTMRRPDNIWELLPAVAPELADWAAYFDAGTLRRTWAEHGQRAAVSAQQAEEMLAEARQFATLAEEMFHA